MKFNYLRSPLLFALLLMPLNSHCREQGSKETQGLELGGLLSSIDSALEGVAEELSSLESTIVKDTESLESMLARYRASIYLRLQCETPDTRSSDPTVVRATHPFEEEYACLSERRKKAHAALEGLLGQQIPKDQLPVIALCGSGGGVRAQFETLGWLRAAERLKILPTLQYVSGLSGSTWALTPWIASKMSVQDYSEQCVPRLTKTIQEHLAELTLHDRKDLFMALARSYFDKRSLSPVDLYGWFLGYLFLKGLPEVDHLYKFSLTSLRPQIESGDFPYIISNSVLGSTELIRNVYGHNPIFEFTPLYSGSFEAGFFIPTWSVGRLFNQGTSQPIMPTTLFPETELLDDALEKLAPEAAQCLEALTQLIEYCTYHTYYGRELSVAHLMGIYGSAFCLDMQNVLLELIIQRYHPSDDNAQEWSCALSLLQDALADELGKLVEQITDGAVPQKDTTHALNNDQFGAALISNPCSQLNGHPLAQQEETALIDAGLGVIEINRCNIGIMPLLNRRVDCIFILDSSADLTNAPTLRSAEKLALKNSLPFPRIPYDRIPLNEVTIISDDTNLEAPVIVYIPVVANANYSKLLGHPFNPQDEKFQALNFTYSSEDAEDLMGLVDYLVSNNLDVCRQALKKSLDRKKSVQLLEKRLIKNQSEKGDFS